MTVPKLLAFAGSTRKDSFNRKLIVIAADYARQAGADVTLIDLADYAMPLYNGDDEAQHGLPENAKRLKALAKAHDGFLISCPEYNSSITPLLKNAIDWMSRQEAGEKSLEVYTGKVAGLMSASPGKLGGLRGLVHVRAILGNIGTLVIPEQVAVSGADKALATPGVLDEAFAKPLDKMCRRLVEVAARLKNEV